jgi:hypothetical protein
MPLISSPVCEYPPAYLGAEQLDLPYHTTKMAKLTRG